MNASTPGDATVSCAYDGSVNAHWVARYAIRVAMHTPARRLRLLHVEDRHQSAALLERKLEHVLGDCAAAGVEASVQALPASGSVAEALLAHVAGGDDSHLLCGARARGRHSRFLADTVSQTLLRLAPCNVLALRVVSPGLLGAPRRLLLAVAGNPGEGRAAARFVAPFVPDLEALHLLRVVVTDEDTLRHAPHETLTGMRAYAQASLAHAEAELRAVLDPGTAHLDAHVRLDESWSRPALVVAGQQRCGLVLARASMRTLERRDRELETLLGYAPCDVGIYRPAP